MIPEWGDGRNYINTERIRARIKVRVERAGDGPWRKCITTKAKEVQVIPDEAVEAAVLAAAKVLYADKMSNHSGDNAPQIIDACEVVARKILEAAAPHLMAAVWEEGYMFSYDQERGGHGVGAIPVPEYLADDLAHWNPHRTPHA